MNPPQSIWIYDPNIRVYKRDADGHAIGGPIYRESWAEHEIVSETSQSYVTRWGRKIPKRKDKQGNWVAFSLEEVNQKCWTDDNAYKISDLVRRASYEQLREITTILNYKDSHE